MPRTLGREPARRIDVRAASAARRSSIMFAAAAALIIAYSPLTLYAPIGAYNVSGEYAMIKAAAAANMIDERRAALAARTSMRRAGSLPKVLGIALVATLATAAASCVDEIGPATCSRAGTGDNPNQLY